jgi:hypothetical protein
MAMHYDTMMAVMTAITELTEQPNSQSRSKIKSRYPSSCSGTEIVSEADQQTPGSISEAPLADLAFDLGWIAICL